MNRSRIRVVGWAMVLVASAVIAPAAEVVMETQIPTAELDEHYLRVAKADSYTYAMLELGIRMGAATAVAMDEDRTEQALEVIAAFSEQYQSVAAMVPSWRRHFDRKAIDALVAAVQQGADRVTMRRRIGAVEKACTTCHVRYMVPVQARYRWGTFSEISLDGDDGQEVDFHTIMLDLSNGLGALRGDVQAGDMEAAQGHYERVRERFTMMELACTACHEEPREYFIDSRVKSHLFKIGGMLRKGSADAAAYTQQLNAINEVSCLPCHQVHMPAAFLQRYSESVGQ